VILPEGAHNIGLRMADGTLPPSASAQPHVVSFLIPQSARADQITYQVGDETFVLALKQPESKQPATRR